MQDSKILYGFTWAEGEPSIEDVSNKFNIPIDDIDSEFGVVLIDAVDNYYTIYINQNSLPSNSGPNDYGYKNIRIAPFGLEEE